MEIHMGRTDSLCDLLMVNRDSGKGHPDHVLGHGLVLCAHVEWEKRTLELPGEILQNDHLGICIGAHTSGIDFRVHANSVKLATPNYSNTETPWLNVEVKLLVQPHAGQTGWVKDVFVDSNRSLRLVVYLCSGKTCTVGHSEVLERWTGKLLLDHQPLKPHQSQFDVDVPWKDVEVVIQSGSFVSSIGIVKDVRRDFRGSLRVLLWIVQHNCSVEVDHSAVMERRTFMPLLESLPLHDHQLKRFSVNSTFEAMRTGPVPWVGLLVDFVKGEYKSEHGAVRDVNRYAVDSQNPQGRSGLTLTVERYTFSANSSNRLVKVDYNAVRYHKTKHLLCDVFMPTAKQSFYIPNTSLFDASTPLPIASTPMPNDFERETIFTGIWAPDYVYPDPLESPLSPDPVHASESPPPPDPRRTSPPLPEPPLQHWILHPKLLGIPIQVDINGGELDTSTKKAGIFVKTINSVNGISVVCQHFGKTITVPYTSVVSFHERPKPATEKGLMVVARGSPQFIGTFVRQIYHFYENEKTDENHMLVAAKIDRSGSLETHASDFLDVHPLDLEYVQETPEERKHSKTFLEYDRAEMRYTYGVQIRPRNTDFYR
ncbi:hypothetical protein BT96DRAFT_1008518 [Gymnopus androsaceus JB14]|uniref:Uncharacterized protein n=1 Tax=Gymnopus androsaceus JB14 TaxID=1447944 RepID=A0A6A4GEP5_9AGAR|nr:hypothetical protein BT96DRAFT_1008518 [Gymnopus androsaceus JB14]